MVEILVVVIIVGVLSAIIAPSFLGMFNRNKVNDALAQVRGALQEAQREAIRRSKSCTVTIDTTKKEITGNPGGCLPLKRDLCDKRDNVGNCVRSAVEILTNLSGATPSLKFSFRGNTNKLGTIIVYSSDNSTKKMACLVVSNGIGVMRTGFYDGSIASAAAIDPDDCHHEVSE
jgi:type II secretory pathway pseudopilin PulG